MCEISKAKVLHHWSANVPSKDRKWKETVLKNTQFLPWCQKKSSYRWKLRFDARCQKKSSHRWNLRRIRCEPTVEPKLWYNLPSCSFHVNTHWILDRCDKYRTSTNLTCATVTYHHVLFTWYSTITILRRKVSFRLKGNRVFKWSLTKVTIYSVVLLITWRALKAQKWLPSCLVPVRLSPRPSRSIDFGDVSRTNAPE